jgi:rSAM/selenodomain-associated transferase 1
MPAGALVLGLFAKWPCAGAVKTRLAAELGPERAAQIALAFLLDSLDRLAAVSGRRVIAFTPDDAAAGFLDVADGRFDLRPQGDGDLGTRMARFLSAEVDSGADAVVLVGADGPTLPLAFIGRAFEELQRADVVLGPATDGGYYLIGCARRVPPVFDGVEWGTSRVLTQTMAQLPAPDWRLSLLPPWYDVDTPADWDMLRGHVAALRRAGLDPSVPRTEELLREERR